MKRVIPILLVVMTAVATGAATSARDQQDTLLSLLPPSGIVPGWVRTDSARIYRGKDLYLFIDGGADLFFEYGFRQVAVEEYHRGATESISLEIYEMNDPGAAFGIFSVRSGGEVRPVDIGDGISFQPYYLMFWKGRFYVSIAASDSSADHRNGMETIARAIDQRLVASAGKPLIMQSLPHDNLMNEGYFRGYLGLSAVRLLDMAEVFPAAEGAFGIYADYAMILLKYNQESEAGHRLAEVIGKLKSDGRFKGYNQRDQITKAIDPGNRTVCVGRSGSFVIISVSPNEPLAESSCTTAITLLGGKRP
jgi:hypothetical protein